MTSYFKSQWWRALVALFCLLYAIHFMAQPAPDETTLEGVKLTMQYMINAIAWLVSGLLWAYMSISNWHEENIRELIKRVQALENQAITDIDELGPNHFIARRRLGPDKDVPRPNTEPTIEERIEVSNQNFTYLKATQDTLGFIPGKEESVRLTGDQLKEFALRIMEDTKHGN